MPYNIIAGFFDVQRSLVLTLPLWILTIGILKILKRDTFLKSRKYLYREMLLATYLLVLLKTTGITWDGWQSQEWISFNFIPFVTQDPLSIVLNVLLFIPFGILLPLTFYKMRKWTKVLLAGLIFITAVELMQLLFFGRTFDIDDLLSNLSGVIIGYGVFWLQSHRLKSLGKNEKYAAIKSLQIAAVVAGVIAVVSAAVSYYDRVKNPEWEYMPYYYYLEVPLIALAAFMVSFIIAATVSFVVKHIIRNARN